MTRKRLGDLNALRSKGFTVCQKNHVSNPESDASLGLDIENRLGNEQGSMAVPVASKCFIPRTPYFPDEILEPANQIDGGRILIVASYPNSMCKGLHPRVSALQYCFSCRFAQECRCRSRH